VICVGLGRASDEVLARPRWNLARSVAVAGQEKGGVLMCGQCAPSMSPIRRPSFNNASR
jgi:hypothetical protein